MRVLLADDQSDVRRALRLLLEQEPDLSIVGEADQIGNLLSELQTTLADLVLLDWELPHADATNALRSDGHLMATLRAIRPELLIIALSGLPEARELALAAGVDGFISKGEPPDRLLTTLREVVAGGRRKASGDDE